MRNLMATAVLAIVLTPAAAQGLGPNHLVGRPCLEMSAPSPIPIQTSSNGVAAEQLASYVRNLITANEAPRLSADLTLQLVMGGTELTMNAEQFRTTFALQKKAITSHSVTDFKVLKVDCGARLCLIRYSYKFSARVGTSETSGAAEAEEVYLRTGSSFELARAYQVQ